MKKQSLLNRPISTNVILPNQMRFLLIDQISQNYNVCNNKSLNYLIDISERIKNSNSTIEIECQCSSIYISKNIFIYLIHQEKLQINFHIGSILSNDPTTKDTSRVLSIIFDSVGFLLLLALVIGNICYLRKSSIKNARISKLSNIQDADDTRLEERVQTGNIQNIHDIRDYSSIQTSRTSAIRDRSLYYIASIDLAQVEDNRHRKRRRQPTEPQIDYDITLPVYCIEYPE
ncbi:unnamed protein product [Rotaria sordida]|uniref:Uncharacterized protein n=1 Tax=Rotaria sordida TaxID=392033 RepID=A0A818NB31_9BILA|nr:unnamed protein product [Rotaria sordida]CAF3602529.1 unnamed protein product [Rotaria sordida]